MQVIGFANKFYTLWNVTEETRPLGNGCNYVITHFTFIKNVSFDKETALKKYPKAKLDESLRGHTVSFNTEKKVWDNVNTFRFGKYFGQKIEEVDDINYIAWYWGSDINWDHKEFVGEVLKKHGYEIHDYTGCSGQYLVSPEQIIERQKAQEKFNKSLNMAKNGETFEFVAEYSLNEYGEYREGDVIFEFPFKLNYYQGYEYGLPLLNGKAKRIKNKTIRVTEYDFEENGCTIIIKVKNFEIA